MRSICVALLVVAVASCSRNQDRAASGTTDVVAKLDDHHTLSEPVTVGNLTVWPVLTDRPLDLGEFLTLDEAVAEGVAEVREVGDPAVAALARQVLENEMPAGLQAADLDNGAQTDDQADDTAEHDSPAEPPVGTPATRHEAGQVLLEELPAAEGQEEEAQTLTQVLESVAVVNTLVIENKGDLPILVCAGTVVKGGNQDRQIGQDFVLKAHSTTPVDAFCVEPGRWESDRLGEETDGKFQVLEGMATAKIRAKGQYEKDQGAVWQEVGKARGVVLNASAPAEPEPVGVVNPENVEASFAFQLAGQSTSYAAAVDANNAASAEDLKRCEDAVMKHFADHEGAVGFAYAVNGEPVAVRTFAHARLLGKHLDDFVRGMATEALLAKGDAPAKQARAEDVVALVRKISAANETIEATAGLNRNGVKRNDVGFNANCYVVDEEGNPSALTQDWTRR